jgi:para-aminobenzoate synthetase component 1
LFVTPLNADNADLQTLSTPSIFWPLWLKEGDGWCLGIAPLWLLVADKTTLRCYERQTDLSYQATIIKDDFLTRLKSQFSATPCPAYPLSDGFTGGLMGWMSYPNSSRANSEIVSFPSMCLGFYDVFIRPNDEGQVHLYAPTVSLAETVLAQLQTPPTQHSFTLTESFQALMSENDYQSAFARVQDYLHSGDCYQVNLAQAFKARCSGQSIEAFQRLLTLSQPPYAAYVSCPFGDILSLSPELFLQFSEDSQVLTRPIKGTRPRRQDSEEDLAQLNDLASHPKDHAENVMIVDLLRHDLGKHAAIGSVKVPKLFSVESFPQVHHLISDVSCRLKQDSSPLDLLFDAFPGGSITGAPKKRAMEIIDELENCDRAIYCGTIGYLTTTGRGQWNIAIRTLLRVENDIYAWAGGGIVADSVCESEYEECFNKIGAMLNALEDDFSTK